MIEKIGERIKKLRIENRLSQKELAEIINTKEKNISKWETGRTKPTSDKIMEIAKHFKVDVNYLYGFDTNENNEGKLDLFNDFLDKLIDAKVISDPNNIDAYTQNLIMNLVKAQISLKLKQRQEES